MKSFIFILLLLIYLFKNICNIISTQVLNWMSTIEWWSITWWVSLKNFSAFLIYLGVYEVLALSLFSFIFTFLSVRFSSKNLSANSFWSSQVLVCVGQVSISISHKYSIGLATKFKINANPSPLVCSSFWYYLKN